MTDLPASLRAAWTEQYSLTTLAVCARAAAADGSVKYLLACADGAQIETVYLPDAPRGTVCVSTQVGCPFGCRFCATGQSGFTRNLTAAEIVAQVYRVRTHLAPGQRVTNIVYMGMGEPLANYAAVLRSVQLLLHPQGMNLAQRHITISTVGLTPGIDRLAAEGLQLNLALSLHAPTQAGRLALLPIAATHPLDEVMGAVRRYVEQTGRKVTFEYTVVPGVNDHPAALDALAALVRGLPALVNVIPLSPTPDYAPSQINVQDARHSAEAVVEGLRRRRVEVALRRSRGQEVGGACGQLRRRR